MDDDGSGRITYREFSGMVREELKLTSTMVSDETLRMVWTALDNDQSGFISANEFGRFMRKGAPAKDTPWRERVGEKNKAAASSVRYELQQHVGKDLAVQLKDIVPATAEVRPLRSA